jgi:cobalt/nickel transport system permease protein
MHISEGILPWPVLSAGAGLAAGGTFVGLRKLDYEHVPRVGVMAAAFFVVSLIHVPLLGTSVHLIGNGLAGLILGWQAFPAILVGLFLQALLFQFGGFTTLGVNTLDMALPAVLVGVACRPLVSRSSSLICIYSGGFLAGFLAVLMAGILTALALTLAGNEFSFQAKIIFVAHIPIMIIEGIICALCIGFLRSMKPEILGVKR